jgi:hypothetical protein
MILVLTVFAGLTVVTGCGSAASPPSAGPSATIDVAPSPLQVTTPAPNASVSDTLPAGTAATSSGGGSSGSGSSGDNAVLYMRDGQGDSFTQTFAFGSPEPESDVSDAIDGMQTCQLTPAIPSRNLVVPVQITTTLTTSVQTQIPIEVDVTDYAQAGYSTAGPNAGIPGDVIYRTTSGDLCATDQTGAEVTLSQGQSATTQAWIVLQDAITPAYPNGDQAQLGVNFIYFGSAGEGDVTSAQGTAVCTGDPQTQQMYSPPYLVFAGNAPSGEGCDGRYSELSD